MKALGGNFEVHDVHKNEQSQQGVSHSLRA